MSRALVLLLVVVVVIVGGMALLAGRAHQRPLTHVEQPVDLANLS
jgi:hypothetical protein